MRSTEAQGIFPFIQAGKTSPEKCSCSHAHVRTGQGLCTSTKNCGDFPGGPEGLPGGSEVKNLPVNEGVNPWVCKIPWRRKWQPTPVFLPGKSHGQRSLMGYSPWGRKRVTHDLATEHAHWLSRDEDSMLPLQGHGFNPWTGN